jgi:hypothetical protein
MRHNPLGQTTPAKPRRLARVTTPATAVPKQSALTRTVLALSDESFACLLADADLDEARRIRAEFAAWCAAHSKSRDWRVAWRSWRAAPGKAPRKRTPLELAIARMKSL